MVNTFHITAQYLATAAISFLDKKDDDSHTNLGWKNGALHTHPFDKNNTMLSLDYVSFSLIFTNDAGLREQFFLDGKTHAQAVDWIQETASQATLHQNYQYKLHYELPYDAITNDVAFNKPPGEDIRQLIKNRNLVQQALEQVLKNKKAPIRIWPHHFDSGAFYMENDEVGIGLGMAIPDGMIDDFYLYVSGYHGHDAIELPSSTAIEKGSYYNDGWKGFALPVSGISQNGAIQFYTQAIHQYINL